MDKLYWRELRRRAAGQNVLGYPNHKACTINDELLRSGERQGDGEILRGGLPCLKIDLKLQIGIRNSSVECDHG